LTLKAEEIIKTLQRFRNPMNNKNVLKIFLNKGARLKEKFGIFH